MNEHDEETHTTESRSLQVTKADMSDVNEAMAWVIGKLDTDFQQGEGLSIRIEQMHHQCDEHDNQVLWNAMVNGFLPTGEHEDVVESP